MPQNAKESLVSPLPYWPKLFIGLALALGTVRGVFDLAARKEMVHRSKTLEMLLKEENR